MVSAEDYPRHTVCMEKRGLDKECEWKLGDPDNDKKCPHIRETRDYSAKIKDSILDCVGNTPLVRINNITKSEGLECELLVKCEFLNPGGSVKDRIGRRMVLDAEKTGRLKNGDIIIEPTSGNTGVGLSMAAAAKGYRMIITMPEKMSQEKQDALTGLGATVVRTPTTYAFDHRDSHVGVAFRLTEELPNAHCLDQYKNTGNPMAHYEGTGQEIWDQCEGKIDYVFMGAGTGGTMTGIARKLKEKNPNIKIVAVDPEGSILAQPDSLNGPGPEGGQQTEGVGYDFLPRVLDRTVADEWMKAADKESFIMARRLLREEGLMCGGSSGSAMYCAIDYIKQHKIGKGKRCVVLLPDNIRNYMTKHLNMDWMYERGYVTEEQCANAFVSDLVPNTDWGQDITVGQLDLPDAVFLSDTDTVGTLVQKLSETGFAQFPVKQAAGEKILGVVTKADVMSKLVKQRVTMADPVAKLVQRDLRHVSAKVTLNELGRILTRNKFALVEKTKFVTTSDLLKKVAGQDSLLAQSSAQPQNQQKEDTAPSGIFNSKLALSVTSAAVGFAAASCAVLFAKKNQ